jgi:hypothetical protein
MGFNVGSASVRTTRRLGIGQGVGVDVSSSLLVLPVLGLGRRSVKRRISMDGGSRLKKSKRSDLSTANAPVYVPHGAQCTLQHGASKMRSYRIKHVTYQRHSSLLPIPKIDDHTLRAFSVPAGQYKHNLVAYDLHLHTGRAGEPLYVKLDVGQSLQWMSPPRLEAREPKHYLWLWAIDSGKADIEYKKLERCRVELKEFGVHLRAETTRSLSSI